MSTTPTINLGKVVLRPRITVKNLRRLREDGGIDFAGQDTKPMLSFSVDPIFVVMAVYQLYRDQFEAAGMTEDDLYEICGPEEITQLRGEVTRQMISFSSFWKILSTEMEGLLSGNTSLFDKLNLQQQVAAAGVFGPSS